jgi:hypothetical protein
LDELRVRGLSETCQREYNCECSKNAIYHQYFVNA